MDRPKAAIIRGSVATAAGSNSGRFIEYINIAVLGRIFGPELFGLYRLAIAVLHLGTALSMFGFRAAIPKFVSGHLAKGNVRKSKGVFVFSFLVLVPLSFLAGGLIFWGSDLIAARLFSKDALSPLLRHMAFIVPATVCLEITAAYFLGRKEFLFSALYLNTALRLVFLLAITMLYLLGAPSASNIILGLGLAYVVSFAVSAVHIIKSRLPGEPADLKQSSLLGYSWPLALSTVFDQLVKRRDLYVMGYFLLSADVGHFSACFALSGLILLPQAFITRAALPVMSELAVKKDYAAIKNIYESIINWLGIVSIPILVFFFLFSRGLIVLFFGEDFDFQGLTAVVGLLAAGFLLDLLSGPYRMLLLALGRTRLQMFIGLLSGTLGMVFSILLISTYGLIGAAVSSVLYVSINCALGVYFIKKTVPVTVLSRNLLKVVSAGALAFLGVVVFKEAALISNVVFLSVALMLMFIVSYGILLYWTRPFAEEEMAYLKRKLKGVLFPGASCRSGE
jgi:O-antigen/teichoic acid export membrane protein